MRRLCGNCERIYDYMDPTLPTKPYEMKTGEGRKIISVRLCPYCGCPEHSGVLGNQWERRFHLTDIIKLKEGEIKVSTVNLMLEHPEEMFFETMIFGHKDIEFYDSYMERYRTREEAEKRHRQIVKLLRAGKYRLEPKTYRLILGSEE